MRSIARCSVALALLVFGAALVPDEAPCADRPNIVLIISDDQAWTDFGFMGHEVIRTPRIDRLAAESAVFVNGYVPTSLCRASLATLITGLYGHQHRICCNDPPDGVDRRGMLSFIKGAPALPRILAEAGYLSFQSGKWWEGHFANGGFTHGMTTRGRHGGPGLAIGRKTMQPIYDFVDEAVAADKPFFVWYAPMMPHNPHNPPGRLLRKYAVEGRPPRLAKYWAMCEWFDETCGQLLDFLERKGLEEDTIVVFVVDNGWIQQTGPRKTTRGWFAPKSKMSPYDGGLRTPVMFRWPGRIRPQRRDELVSTVDIVPTLLAAAGLEVHDRLPGRNLLDVLSAKTDLEGRAVFGELYVHTAKDIHRPALNLTHRWVRKGKWKLIVPEKGGVELYDLSSDPHEERDVASSNPAVVEGLRSELRSWWNARPDDKAGAGDTGERPGR